MRIEEGFAVFRFEGDLGNRCYDFTVCEVSALDEYAKPYESITDAVDRVSNLRGQAYRSVMMILSRSDAKALYEAVASTEFMAEVFIVNGSWAARVGHCIPEACVDNGSVTLDRLTPLHFTSFKDQIFDDD